MKEEFAQQLQRVIEEWQKPIKQVEATIKASSSDLSEEEAFAMIREAMVNASCDAFVQLKLLHVLLLN